MRGFITRVTILGGGAVLAVAGVLSTAGAAGAATTSVPHTPTAGCQVASINCAEVVNAVSATNDDFNPLADSAMSVIGGPPPAQGDPVFTRQNANLLNGNQDLTFSVVTTVPFFFGDAGYGLTAFDRSHFGGDLIVQNEVTPFGNDQLGLCENIGIKSHAMSLQPCDGRKGEAFILATHGLLGTGTTHAGYSYLISVRQAANLARHDVLIGNDSGFGQVTVGRALNGAHNTQWAALP